MGLQETLQFLDKNNKAGHKITVDELEKILMSMSAKVNGTRVSFVYSYTINPPNGRAIPAWQVIKAVEKNKNIATLNKTDISQLLESEEFKESLVLATDNNKYEVNRILNGTTDPATGQRLQPGLWDKISEKYVMSIKGPVMTITPNLENVPEHIMKVFVQTELPAILRNPEITTIDGVEKKHFQALYEGAIEKGLSPKEALLQVRETTTGLSKKAVENLRYGVDEIGEVSKIYRHDYAKSEVGPSIAYKFDKTAGNPHVRVLKPSMKPAFTYTANAARGLEENRIADILSRSDGSVRGIVADSEGGTMHFLDKRTGAIVTLDQGKATLRQFPNPAAGFDAFAEKYKTAITRTGAIPVSGKQGYLTLAKDFHATKGFKAKAFGLIGDMGGKVREVVTSAPFVGATLTAVGVGINANEAYAKSAIVDELAEFKVISPQARDEYRLAMNGHVLQGLDISGVGGEIPVQMWYEGWARNSGLPPSLHTAMRPESLLVDVKQAVESVPGLVAFSAKKAAGNMVTGAKTAVKAADILRDHATGETEQRRMIYARLPVLKEDAISGLDPTDIDDPIYRHPAALSLAQIKTEIVRTEEKIRDIQSGREKPIAQLNKPESIAFLQGRMGRLNESFESVYDGAKQDGTLSDVLAFARTQKDGIQPAAPQGRDLAVRQENNVQSVPGNYLKFSM
jgi:hypothetical protein